MDQFDDNGWIEIWEIFGKDSTRSPYLADTENDSVGDEFWFEETGEIPDKLEITSAWPERTNENGKQFKSHDKSELKDEYPKNDAIRSKRVGPTPLSECQGEIYEEYDSAEASLDDAEYDLAGQKFTSEADDEIIETCYKNHDENDPVEEKFTSDANVEMMKECDQDAAENDPLEQKFTGDANEEMMKECDQDAAENDPVGYKFTGDANEEMMKECDQDAAENEPLEKKFTGDANEEMMKECAQDAAENDPLEKKFTNDANEEMMKECDQDAAENDPLEQKFTSDANEEMMKKCDQDAAENDPLEKKFTSNANEEMMKECDQDAAENDPVKQNFTSDADDEIMKECDQDAAENDPLEQKFTSDANEEMIKECDQDAAENDPVGQKFTSDADEEMIKECDQDAAENDPVGQKFTSGADDEIMKERYKDDDENGNARHEFKSTGKQKECDKNCATPEHSETDISPNENVPAEPDEVLSAMQKSYKSHEVLKCNITANKERKTHKGISRYKILFVGNLFQFTLIESQKAISINILFQTLCFVAGFFSCISGVHGESISPRDTFAAVGTTVRFQCSWDLKKPVYWEWTPVHSKTGLFLYIGNGGLVDSADDRITIEKDKGRYDLVITGVLMKHAGTYNCIENSGLGMSMSAELTVLDAWGCSMEMPPGGFMGENVVNIPEDIILASCKLHFSGNMDPAIRWSLSRNVTQNNATMTMRSASTITTSFSMRPTKELDKSVLIAYVEGSGDSSQTGQSWRSQILTVNYVHLVKGPQKGYIDDAKNVLCNPECSFTFNTTYYGATYRFDDRNYEIPRAFDDDTPVPEGESKWLIMLILAVVFFVASLCLLLFVVFYARFKARNIVCAKYGSATTAESETKGSIESEEFLKVSA